MHNPPCETWQVHLRRELVALEEGTKTLSQFVDDVLHSWETELLVNDDEFLAQFEALTDETRRSLDLARQITAPERWARIESLPASPDIT